jgi:hypothetical protein
MAQSSLARLVPADEPLQDERLQDELAQFISEELHHQDVQLSARPKPAATRAFKARLFGARLARRQIQIDNSGFTLFRVC